MATTAELFANLPQTTVTSGGTGAPTSGTQETWTVSSSSQFPAASNTASPPTQFHVADTASGKTTEMIAVTNVSGTTWTVTRGAESTTPVTHSAGFTIYQVVTAAGLGGMLQSANNLSDVASAATSRTNLGVPAIAGDIGGTSAAPQVTGTHLAAPLPLAQGGTSGATQQAALDAIAGAVTSGLVLRGNGTHVALAAIQAGDVPTLNQSTTGNAATATNLAGGATLPAYLAPKAVTLTFGVTISVDASLGNAFNLTLTASTGTIASPANPVDGEVIRFRITQDATGSRTVAWGAAYDFGSGSAPTLTATAGKTDILAFEYLASASKWCYLGAAIPQSF